MGWSFNRESQFNSVDAEWLQHCKGDIAIAKRAAVGRRVLAVNVWSSMGKDRRSDRTEEVGIEVKSRGDIVTDAWRPS